MNKGVLTIVVVAVIVAGVAFSGWTSRPGPSTSPNPGTAAGTPATTGAAPASTAKVVYPVLLVLECENPATLEDKAPNGTVVLKKGKQSEGTEIGYLEIEDRVLDVCGVADEDKAQAGRLPGKASYTFTAPREDTYYVNLRARWYDTCGNSVWLKIDDGEWFRLEDENGRRGESFQWAWHQLKESGAPVAFKLKDGPHTLWLAVREDGPKLDQWVITTEASEQVGDAVKPEQASGR